MIEIESDYQSLFKEVIGRDETELLSNKDLYQYFSSSRILIIGAGGSIGSAIASRLGTAGLENVYFLDRDESALHVLKLKLGKDKIWSQNHFFVADIRDRQSITEVLDLTHPTIVIHAAALKHLVILERFPREGFLTNIIGTLNVAELCKEAQIPQFINISTDKAANPISILGKTKKIAELLTEEVFRESNLIQCSVRFGNVFATRGSVIETFIHQIQNNLPVTITDFEVSRYFMSRNEAGNLVLAATSLKDSGTYIQNMGQEVKIIEVISRLAKYMGKNPQVELIGLQKGEKIKEELFDGPSSLTKFSEIFRSEILNRNYLINEIKADCPSNSSDAFFKIQKLYSIISKKDQGD
jgi:FlaA1/EpsC-like NDP-sugar epimerase